MKLYVLGKNVHMHPRVQSRSPCAVCGQCFKNADLCDVDVDRIDLTCLQNDFLPACVLPSTYDFALYDRAILCPAGLDDPWALANMKMCISCRRAVVDKGLMPVDALANFQYYAYSEIPQEVHDAFQEASMFDLMLVVRARATRVSFLLTEKFGVAGDPRSSQGYVKGNVAIMPQDTLTLRTVILPDQTEIRNTMCALLIGHDVTPAHNNISKLGPVLVNKNIVRTLANFLVNCNKWYHGVVSVADTNIDHLFDGIAECGVPKAVELWFLESSGDASATSQCTDVGWNEEREGDDFSFLDAVGYTEGDYTLCSVRQMKAVALAHCLDGKQFLQVQSGGSLVNESNPGLLAWAFPQLNLFGIGGFNDPNRGGVNTISFSRQVRNLVLQHESPFTNDPNFAYVCWNVLQKRKLNRSLCFRVAVGERETLGRRLYELAPVLMDLI